MAGWRARRWTTRARSSRCVSDRAPLALLVIMALSAAGLVQSEGRLPLQRLRDPLFVSALSVVRGSSAVVDEWRVVLLPLSDRAHLLLAADHRASHEAGSQWEWIARECIAEYLAEFERSQAAGSSASRGTLLHRTIRGEAHAGQVVDYLTAHIHRTPSSTGASLNPQWVALGEALLVDEVRDSDLVFVLPALARLAEARYAYRSGQEWIASTERLLQLDPNQTACFGFHWCNAVAELGSEGVGRKLSTGMRERLNGRREEILPAVLQLLEQVTSYDIRLRGRAPELSDDHLFALLAHALEWIMRFAMDDAVLEDPRVRRGLAALFLEMRAPPSRSRLRDWCHAIRASRLYLARVAASP